MVECKKCLDPTSYGLFLVAIVSLPIALFCLLKDDTDLNLGLILAIGGLLIIMVSFLCYKAESNFGFIVFGLVGFGVLMSGMGGLGFYGNLSFAIVYALAIIWSVLACTPKLLTFILFTTALIFLFGGLSTYMADDLYMMLEGIAALGNFAFSVYLAFALALEDKLPVF